MKHGARMTALDAAARNGAGPRAASGRRLAAVLLVLLVALAGFARPALAELTFPALTGRVVDSAHVLDASTLSALDAKLAAQEQKTSDQVVVATVPSLQGTSIEDYANRLFRHWGIGQKEQNNGVLLLVAPAERKVRIEVGYGLEGIITDLVASTIIRTAIIPAFKAGDMAGGIVKGTDAILTILNLDPEEARARAKALERAPEDNEDVANIIFLVLMLAFWVFIFWRIASQGRGGPRGPRGGRRAGPISTWDWSNGSGGWSSGGGGGGWSGGGGSSGGGGASGGW